MVVYISGKGMKYGPTFDNFILGSISGGLIGYLFSSFARSYFYDISKFSIEKRKRILRQIILRNLNKH